MGVEAMDMTAGEATRKSVCIIDISAATSLPEHTVTRDKEHSGCISEKAAAVVVDVPLPDDPIALDAMTVPETAKCLSKNTSADAVATATAALLQGRQNRQRPPRRAAPPPLLPPSWSPARSPISLSPRAAASAAAAVDIWPESSVSPAGTAVAAAVKAVVALGKEEQNCVEEDVHDKAEDVPTCSETDYLDLTSALEANFEELKHMHKQNARDRLHHNLT